MTSIPWCPQDYNCTFTLVHPRVAVHHIGPWWNGLGGIVVVITAIVALALVLAISMNGITELRKRRLDYNEKREIRAHELAIEEQRTYQAEQAKGNPEILKLIREKV